MTEETTLSGAPDDATWRAGVAAMLSSIDRRLSDVEARLPSQDQQRFEADMFELALAVHATVRLIRRVALFVRGAVLALAPFVAAWILLRTSAIDLREWLFLHIGGPKQ